MTEKMKWGIIILCVLAILSYPVKEAISIRPVTPSSLEMRNTVALQEPQKQDVSLETKRLQPVGPWIKPKGINYAGYPHPSIPWPTFGDAVPEHPLPYWCSRAFNYTYVLEDFCTMKNLGVEHIRLRAEIFQFMIWDHEVGYQGFNQTYINNLKQVVELAGSLNFEVTYCMMSWINYTHANPSYAPFMESFQPTDNTSSAVPLYPTRLNNTVRAFGELVNILKNYRAIHTWEIMNEAQAFYYRGGCHWNYSLESIFLPIRHAMLTADPGRPAIVSSVNMKNLNDSKLWWYDTFSDYFDGHYYNNTGLLPDPSSLTKPIVLGELGGDWEHPTPPSSVLYKWDRRENVYVLTTIWNTFQHLGYQSFMPWEFAENYVLTRSNAVIGTHQQCWSWNALTLYSFYTAGVDFLATNCYVTMISEPAFEGEYIFFKMFIPTPAWWEEPLPPIPNVITTTLKAPHPFYGTPIGGTAGQVLNQYFPPPDIADPASKIPTSGGSINATLYNLLDCKELPILISANARVTLNFTEYTHQRLVVTVLSGDEAIDPSWGTQEKWVVLAIGNYPSDVGHEQFIIEAGQSYRITLEDVTTGEEQSWELIANPDAILELNASLISLTQRLTITKADQTTPAYIGAAFLFSPIMVLILISVLRPRKKPLGGRHSWKKAPRQHVQLL